MPSCVAPSRTRPTRSGSRRCNRWSSPPSASSSRRPTSCARGSPTATARCGPPGLGKTHLLHAIANYVQRFGGGLTVRYATIESFTNEFTSALQRHSIEAFKARFRHIDVLLIDDVQFLAAKAKTEEEFFH